jgi:hypothetical protein
MKKTLIMIFLMAFMVAGVVSAQGVLVNRANVIDSYDEIMGVMAIENDGGQQLGRTRVTMMSYDVPFYVSKRIADFDMGNVESRMMAEPVYGIDSGCFTIRFSASNEDADFRRIVHREICTDGNGYFY